MGDPVITRAEWIKFREEWATLRDSVKWLAEMHKGEGCGPLKVLNNTLRWQWIVGGIVCTGFCSTLVYIIHKLP